MKVDSRLSFLFIILLVSSLTINVYSQQLESISGALITASSSEGYGETTTGSDGRFSLTEGLPIDIYDIVVGAKGYISKQITNVEIETEEETDLGDIQLELSGIVQGKVVDPNGNPQPGIPVQIKDSTEIIIEEKITSSDGSFIFDTNLKTGIYKIEAWPFSFEGFEFRQVNFGFGTISIPVPTPGSIFTKGYTVGILDDVKVNQSTTTTGLLVRFGLSGEITGRISDSQENPIKGILVSAFQSGFGTESGFFGISDNNGYYEITNNLPTGDYNVTLIFPTGYIWNFSETRKVAVESGKETPGIDFRLEMSGIMSGTVVYNDGTPAAEVTVIATENNQEYFGFSTTEIDGTFKIDTGLGTGEYQVMAIGAGFAFSTPVVVQIQAGQETSNVNLIIQAVASGKAAIEGKVTDDKGNPIEAATVTAQNNSTETNENGTYKLPITLSLGEETIEIDVDASKNGYEKSTQEITVTIGETTSNIDFVLTKIKEGILKGRVLGTSMIEPVENQPPQASFTHSPTEPTEDQDIRFTDQSQDPEEKTLTYSWNFGDGSTSTEKNPNHKYTEDGTYIVNLTVTDDEGDQDSFSKTIEVKEKGEEQPASGCLIATATYGSELSPEVQFLRGFRDNTVQNTFAGSQFMNVFNQFYYSFSPTIASKLRENPIAREVTKIFLYPLIGILHLSLTSFTTLGQVPEFAIIITGLLASSLFGVVYLTPVALIASKTRRFKKYVSKTIKALSAILLSCFGLIIIAEIFSSSTVMMIATGTIVIVTITLSTLIAAKRLPNLIKHFRKQIQIS